MLPSHLTRRKKVTQPSNSPVEGVDGHEYFKNKLKMSPYPEATGLSLNSPHPLREINRQEVDCVELERGTSALSTPSSFHVSGIAHQRKQLDDSSGLNMFLDFSEGKGDDKHFSGLKPTHIVSLEKKLNAHCEKLQEEGMGEERNGGPEESTEAESVVGVSQQPTAHVRGVWNSVVSWMRMATDFISRDSNGSNESVEATSTRGKKRGLSDPDYSDSPTKKQPRSVLTNERGRGRKRGGPAKNESQGNGVEHDTGFKDLMQSSDAFRDVPSSPITSLVTVSSPPSTLATQLSNKLAIASPIPMSDSVSTAAVATAVPSAKWKPSHLEACSGSNLGLNSILDKSFQSRPVPKKIRRQSLRSFYGNSVNSPNLTQVPASAITVRRSPRNHSSSIVPVPPPPPPIPAAPPLPPVPLPLPYKASSHSIAPPPMAFSPALPRTGGADPSRDMLSQMQSRLRSRIKKKGVAGKEAGKRGRVGLSEVDGNKLDVKNKQWAEIQAHRRKVSLENFLSLAAEKKDELGQVLSRLDLCLPSTFKEVSKVVETLQEGAQWFAGGNKDMRESLPLYKTLEQKIETLTEYVHVCMEMNEVFATGAVSTNGGQHQGTLDGSLHPLREEFDARHRHWGAIVASNAESWSSLQLPVCHRLLARSCDHMCHLVKRYVSICLEESRQLTGILVSSKCLRTSKLKESLKNCLNFLSGSTIYFCFDRTCQCTSQNCQFCPSLSANSNLTQADGTDPRDSSAPQREEGTVSHSYDQSMLVSFCVAVLMEYVRVAVSQYDGFVKHSARQNVCEHFEGILKLISIIKTTLCIIFSTKANSVRNSGGYLQLIQDPEELGQKLYECCEKLVQHIVDKAGPMEADQVSSSELEVLSKEIMLWMMFGCKYIHQSLEFLGTERAQKMGLVKLLQQLQHMEDLL